MVRRNRAALPLAVLVSLHSSYHVHSLLSPPQIGVHRRLRCDVSSSARRTVRLQQSSPHQIDVQPSQETAAGEDAVDRSLYRHLASYSLHWDNLLQREYTETTRELQARRKSYTRSQLQASGLAIFNAVATPETELYGEKIVRITLPTNMYASKHITSDDDKLRNKFKRGDVLVMTPEVQFKGRDIDPREGLVMDVGSDFLTLGVGSTWPSGVMEMRKHDSYRVRLDRAMSSVPLRAQRLALERLRKGEAGSVANLLVQLFYDDRKALEVARETPSQFEYESEEDLEEQIVRALGEATADTTFEPNSSQREAVVSALKRKVALIRGPPGTGKTRCSALLISTALKMQLKNRKRNDEGEEDDDATPARTPRVLAVTHSNGAADVLLQALLQLGVPAVRAGRPASVSESVQHRTIAALAERMPEVVRLRKQAGDAALDREVRQTAIYDAKQYLTDAQTTIARSAPVVVASCIGAQQPLASIGETKEDGGSSFPVVVLDEAGQTTESALICALSAAKAKQVILVGDTKQLPPTVTTVDVDLRKAIGVSPMERLLKNGVDEFVLKVQYRMPKALLQHPNDYFYKGEVKCATASVAFQNQRPVDGFPWPSPTKEPLAFLHVGKDSEVMHGFGGRTNPSEVELVMDIIQRVVSAGNIEAKNIAIITPYSKQVQLFRNELVNAHRNSAHKLSDVRVGTVDSFQGQETDLVVFSAVRSNLLKELGFLRDARRLNVAITRARRGLIVVGDPTVLRTCQHWSALIDSCVDRGCVLTKEEYDCQSRGVSAIAGAEQLRAINLELDRDDEFYGLFDDDGELDDI